MLLPRTTDLKRRHLGLTAQQIERAWIAVLIGAGLALALINLPYAPRTWFDEGSHLHVPKTIVQDGVYADKSSEGYRYHGPTIGIGPTIMLPIALVFKLFGIGLVQGRLVIVAYALLATVAFFALSRRMYGRMVAPLAVTLLLASRTLSYEGWVEYGRQVLGEVPGMAFFFLGMLAWLGALRAETRAREGKAPASGARAWGLPLLAGVGFGLTLVTKNQFALIVAPGLALLTLLDWLYYRAASWRLRLAPPIVAGLCFALWTFAQLQFLGPGTFFENLQQTRQAAGGAIFVFNIRSTLRAGYYLLRPDLYGGLLIPALLYTLWRARERGARGLAEALPAVMIELWLVWYVFVSLGWPRYAFPAVALSALPIARLIIDAVGWLRSTGRERLALAAGIYTLLIVAVPLALSIGAVFSPDDTPQRFAAYLDANVPRDVIIETWDPELGALTDHRYHYPPQALLDTVVRAEWLGGPPAVYNWQETEPPFLALGPFSQYSGVYAVDELERDYTPVQRIGLYVLYQRR